MLPLLWQVGSLVSLTVSLHSHYSQLYEKGSSLVLLQVSNLNMSFQMEPNQFSLSEFDFIWVIHFALAFEHLLDLYSSCTQI